MAYRIIGAIVFWGLAVFAAREAWINHTTGVGHMEKFGPRDQRREDDPESFRWGLGAKVFGALAFLVAGVIWLIAPW